MLKLLAYLFQLLSLIPFPTIALLILCPTIIILVLLLLVAFRPALGETIVEIIEICYSLDKRKGQSTRTQRNRMKGVRK